VLSIWLPVALWTIVIAMESFFGSSGNTGPLLKGILTWLFGQAHPVIFDRLHFVLRKGGHFLGYGIYGYLWLRALSATFPNGRRIIWAGLAIACTFLIASLDEWHQSFSPARTGHFGDVLLDTCGALLLVSIAMVAIRRRTQPSAESRSAYRQGRSERG
jgi:VanZ family protein